MLYVLLQQPCDCESQPLGVSPLNGSDVEEKQQQRTVATFWEASSCLLHNEDGRRLGVYNARILYHYCFCCCFLYSSPPTKCTLRRVWDQMSKSLAPPTSAHALSQGSAAQPLMRPAASPWASLSAQCWMPPGSRLAGRTFSPSRSTFLSFILLWLLFVPNMEFDGVAGVILWGLDKRFHVFVLYLLFLVQSVKGALITLPATFLSSYSRFTLKTFIVICTVK